MTSKKYNQLAHAADQWLVQNAPKWVTDVVSEGVTIFKRLTNRWMYVGMINESALYMIIRECNEAPIQTPMVKGIRKIAIASIDASKKAFKMADEDTFPTPQDSITFLMEELHGEEFAEAVSTEVKRRGLDK